MKVLWVFVFIVSMLCACGKQLPPTTKSIIKYYRVQPSTVHRAMHFTGIIQPLREKAIISPMDGVVESVSYVYGYRVQKGQTIFIVNSQDLQRQYNETLTYYLKSKDSYRTARSKFTGTQALWKAGLLPKNNYLSEKSSVTTAHIALMQASHKLAEWMRRTEIVKPDDLMALNLTQFNKVRAALSQKYNLIPLKSPSDGVVLYPLTSEESFAKGVNIGTHVKSGQVLGIVGDLSGIHVEIDVPEVDIGAITPGMSAIIRGVAFGKHVLAGTLVAVNSQASTSAGGSLPAFTAIVEVHNLSQAQQAWIKVGMSAEIEILVDNVDKFSIPIAAVKSQAGMRFVQVLAKNGVIAKRAVTTGVVNNDQVQINFGLVTGDLVVYD